MARSKLERIVISEDDFLDDSVFSDEPIGQTEAMRLSGIDKEEGPRQKRIQSVFSNHVKTKGYGWKDHMEKYRTSMKLAARFLREKEQWASRRKLYEKAWFKKKEKEIRADADGEIAKEVVEILARIAQYDPKDPDAELPYKTKYPDEEKTFAEWIAIFQRDEDRVKNHNSRPLYDAAERDPEDIGYLASTLIEVTERRIPNEDGVIDVSKRKTPFSNMWDYLLRAKGHGTGPAQTHKRYCIEELLKHELVQQRLSRYRLKFELPPKYKTNAPWKDNGTGKRRKKKKVDVPKPSRPKKRRSEEDAPDYRNSLGHPIPPKPPDRQVGWTVPSTDISEHVHAPGSRTPTGGEVAMCERFGAYFYETHKTQYVLGKEVADAIDRLCPSLEDSQDATLTISSRQRGKKMTKLFKRAAAYVGSSQGKSLIFDKNDDGDPIVIGGSGSDCRKLYASGSKILEFAQGLSEEQVTAIPVYMAMDDALDVLKDSSEGRVSMGRERAIEEVKRVLESLADPEQTNISRDGLMLTQYFFDHLTDHTGASQDTDSYTVQ